MFLIWIKLKFWLLVKGHMELDNVLLTETDDEIVEVAE